MASKKRNNCPRSDRSGIFVLSEVNKKAVQRIESKNGCIFMPDAADRQAALDRESRPVEEDNYESIPDGVLIEDEDENETADAY